MCQIRPPYLALTVLYVPEIGLDCLICAMFAQPRRGETPWPRRWAACRHAPLHPTPYTLHPTPYTLHPTPYTLHPTPYTLHHIRVLYIYECCCVYTSVDKHETQLRGSDLDLAISKAFATPVYIRVLTIHTSLYTSVDFSHEFIYEC